MTAEQIMAKDFSYVKDQKGKDYKCARVCVKSTSEFVVNKKINLKLTPSKKSEKNLKINFIGL